MTVKGWEKIKYVSDLFHVHRVLKRQRCFKSQTLQIKEKTCINRLICIVYAYAIYVKVALKSLKLKAVVYFRAY